jgi:hypothetical protein
MTDPFDDLRDHLVSAIARSARAKRWAPSRSHHVGVVLVALALAGTATAAVVSLTSEGSAPLVGQVPKEAGAGSAHVWGLEAGEHYRITVWPVLQGGSSGVCTAIRFAGPRGVGYGQCGAPYPTKGMPFLGPGGWTRYQAGVIPKGGTIEYLLTGPRVASVRIGAHLLVTPRREPGLPAGDRAAVFYLPAGSPQIDPPWAPQGVFGRRGGTKALAVTALGRDGMPIPINSSAHAFRLPAGFWERPGREPKGACSLRAPQGYRALRGTVAFRLVSQPGVEGAALTSCLSVDYQLAGTTLTAAVLVNARSPRSAPSALFGATPVAGEPGLVNREEGQDPDNSGFLRPFTARRDGAAWIVVQGGDSTGERIRAVRALEITRISDAGPGLASR